MKITQTKLVLDHMKRYGSITTLEAFQRYGITRLAARISDIRKSDNYFITSKMVEVKTREGKKTHVSRYYLHGKTGGDQ